MVGQTVVLAAAVCRGIMLARMLNPADLGRLFLLLSGAGLAAGLGLTGFAVVGLRRVAASDGPESASRNIRGVVQLVLVANGTLLILTALVRAPSGMSVPETLAFAALVTVVLWIGLLSALARGLGHIVFAIQQEQVAVPIAQVLALGLCLVSRGTLSVAFLMTLLAGCAVPSLLWLGRPVAAAAMAHSDPVSVRLRRAVLVESAPVTLNAVVWRAFADLPLWVAGLTIGPEGSALFGVAQRLASLVQLPLAAVASVLTPEVAALLARRQYADLEGRLRRGAALATIGSATGFAVLVIGSHPLLRLVYGPYFERAAQAVIVLGLAQLINSATGMGGVTLQMMNESRRLLLLSVVSLSILAAIVWPLATTFGLTGLAWASMVAVTVQNVLMIHAVRRLTGIRVYMTLP